MTMRTHSAVLEVAADTAVASATFRASGVLHAWVPVEDATDTPAAVDAWADATAYVAGDIVIPTTPNGHAYLCTVAGTSGAVEPAAWATDGTDTTDNDVTWADLGAYTEGYTVTDVHTGVATDTGALGASGVQAVTAGYVFGAVTIALGAAPGGKARVYALIEE